MPTAGPELADLAAELRVVAATATATRVAENVANDLRLPLLYEI